MTRSDPRGLGPVPPVDLTPSAGRIQDGVHFYPLRVFYEDTDAGGVVYYTNYLKFCERARTSLLHLFGFDHKTLVGRDGILFVVRSLQADYHHPAYHDDLLVIRSRVESVGGASVRMLQDIFCDSRRLVESRVRLGVIGPKGRPVRMPDAVRTAFVSLNGG